MPKKVNKKKISLKRDMMNWLYKDCVEIIYVLNRRHIVLDGLKKNIYGGPLHLKVKTTQAVIRPQAFVMAQNTDNKN